MPEPQNFRLLPTTFLASIVMTSSACGAIRRDEVVWDKKVAQDIVDRAGRARFDEA